MGQTDKITRVLSLYTQLLNGNPVDKVWFSMEHNITERSFDRDVEDIRLFLCESFSGAELVFDRTDGKYHLTGERPAFLDRLCVEAILKVLLSSGAFRRDEMEGLADSLLSTASPADRKRISQVLQNDRENYRTETKNAIMKILGDLYEVLNTGRDVLLYFTPGKQELQSQWAAPLEIRFQDGVFSLLAALDPRMERIETIPLDIVDSFKTLGTMYSAELRKKYKTEGKEDGSKDTAKNER